MRNILLIALCALLCHAAVARTLRMPKANANVLVDAVVAKAVEMMKEQSMDPYVLPPHEYLGFIDTEAVLSGLTSIHRSNNATLDFEDGIAVITSEFEIDQFDGEGAVSIKDTEIQAGAEIEIGVVKCYIEIRGQLTGQLNLTKFDFDDIEDVQVFVEGLPDWLANIIDGLCDAIANHFGLQIAKLLDEPVRNILNDVIHNFMPGETLRLLGSHAHPSTPAKYAAGYVKRN